MNDPFYGADDELDARARRIDLAHEPGFAIGPVQVEPSLRKIAGVDGDVMLEPKVMQVLVALASPIGAILSRDDLIERCWEGRVVGDTSINRVISLLRAGFKQVAGDAVVVENVPKVGYRIVIADGAVPAGADAPPASEPATQTEGGGSRKFIWAGGGVLAVLGLIAAFFLMQPFTNTPLPTLRIAMLPLETDESVDPVYAKGLESELRAQFARVGQFEVTASETAAMLVEEGLDEIEVGKRLKADFVWAGKLTTGTDQITLEARLFDVSGKGRDWRETLASATDAGQFLPMRTARSMAQSLGRPVSERMPEARVSAAGYSLYVTAIGLLKGRGVEERKVAYTILEQVTKEHPQFADGWAGLAKAIFLYPDFEVDAMKANRAKALEIAQHALSLDEDSVDGLKIAGLIGEDPETRLRMLNRAVELDPGDSEGWFWLGITRRELILLGEDPLGPARKMVELDPLWPATWTASDMAAKEAKLDAAMEIEREILAAAVMPSQRLHAEARIARLEGDLSRFMSLARQAARKQDRAARLFSSALQERMVHILLDLPMEPAEWTSRESPPELVFAAIGGRLPSLAEMQEQGITAQTFWQNPTFVIVALPLFLRDDREAELLDFYDRAFADHAEFVDKVTSVQNGAEITPIISPYIASALRGAGRSDEADQHLDYLAERLDEFRAIGRPWLDLVLWEISFAAAKGDTAAAIAGVERLPDFGWPYATASIDPYVIALIRDDPLYDEIRNLPEVRAVLDPIRAKLAQERKEVLALNIRP